MNDSFFTPVFGQKCQPLTKMDEVTTSSIYHYTSCDCDIIYSKSLYNSEQVLEPGCHWSEQWTLEDHLNHLSKIRILVRKSSHFHKIVKNEGAHSITAAKHQSSICFNFTFTEFSFYLHVQSAVVIVTITSKHGKQSQSQPQGGTIGKVKQSQFHLSLTCSVFIQIILV